MISRTLRLPALVLCLAAALTVTACDDKPPASPTPVTPPPTPPPPPPTPPPVAPTLAAPTAQQPNGGAVVQTFRPTLIVNNAVAAGDVGNVTYRFEISERADFPVGSRTVVSAEIPQGAGGATQWTLPRDLQPDFPYFWRARATNGTIVTDWSVTATTRTWNRGTFVGQTVYDPLTNGETVGRQRGGHFVPGRGWQSDGLDHALFYDIPTCTSCRIEFDATNFGRAEGAPFHKDLKWLSMGEAGTFGNFDAFRNHEWKMHLEQRADGDGTGMKLIWRNGDAGDGDPGDHTWRNDSTVDWRGDQVFRFTVDWTPGSYSLTVGRVVNGEVVDSRVWVQGTFRQPYAPANHRIELGCSPRQESFIGVIFSNVRISPR
jgi:hypothetical protein